MLRDIFDYPTAAGAAVIAAKTAIVYASLIIGLRWLGKRELGQMSLYDFVMIVILGNAVQNAMIGTDTTLGGGLVAAMILILMNKGFNELIRASPRVEHLLVGEPVLIVHDGKVLEDRMKKTGISMDQLMAALREHGYEKVEGVHLAVLEVDGTISIVPKGAGVHRTKRHFKQLRLP
jgi:uncharacterized membrane protein YcaP (DUF421 family)